MDLHDTRFLQREPLNQRLAERRAQLAAIAAELKTELFGTDEVIDHVIESVRAWYVLPEIIKRPVIFCLWGLTGTGKTQLTRALTHKLGFYDRFVDVLRRGARNQALVRRARQRRVDEVVVAQLKPSICTSTKRS